MSEDNKSALQTILDSSDAFNEAFKQIEAEQEQYWESLTTDQQQMAFCAVARRIHKGEIEEGGTYRYVLYNTFGWGPEAYAIAQMSGYLAIHNSIVTPEQERNQLEHFAKFHNLPEGSVDAYYTATYGR